MMQGVFVGCWAVLFDLDGTLIDTHIDFAQMRRCMVDLASVYGLDAQDLFPQDALAIMNGVYVRLNDTQGVDRAEAYRREAHHTLQQIELSQCANPVQIVGARELLEALHARGIGVAVVTRNSRKVAQQLIEHGRLRCDALLARDDVTATKPDPAHLAAALERLSPLEQAPHGTTVMIGDHWMDMQAGLAAGCYTIGLLRGRPRTFFDPAPPHMLVDGVGDLLQHADLL